MQLPPADSFASRHIGPRLHEVAAMLERIGVRSLRELVAQTVPESIRLDRELVLPDALTERQSLELLQNYAAENVLLKSYLGMGYYDTLTPPVIQRNVLENPGWYTAYTPYQAEISQGRLEALLVYQTVVQELTGLDVANASMLDEATAAAEAMTMAHRVSKVKFDRFFVDENCHPQTLAVLQTRATPLGIEIVVGDATQGLPGEIFAALVQYPDTKGRVVDWAPAAEQAHAADAMLIVATDLIALRLLKPPGAFGADIAVGSSQRLGVPLGFGGPHAGFLAARTGMERQLPGRLIGQSVDANGNPALRMALQTREQHIRRQKATSNICTAQVLLAVIAAMYVVWHGPEGLERIARRIHRQAVALASALRAAGWDVDDDFFDTVHVRTPHGARVVAKALSLGINLRLVDDGVCIALDESVRPDELPPLLAAFDIVASDLATHLSGPDAIPTALIRAGVLLQQPVFHEHRSETEMMRYLFRLQSRDVALNTSMIPLGSCTMKLNAAAEMMPVTFPGFSRLHPFVPPDQMRGYARLFSDLEQWLAEITGFDAVSLQPNAGSQGEYAGLLTIRDYHLDRGDAHRNICLIPTSAHGTNPASAVMAGMEVVPVACDAHGNIDFVDLSAKAEKYADRLAAMMITYPSTHGVFETQVKQLCATVHRFGGLVYLDGANMNAMVGLCRPGDIGADVCHLNLHKTFAIPHGGGGPGMGPIGVKAHLAPFLPGHSVVDNGSSGGAVSAAPWGSPSILVITWAYIAMLGAQGVREASEYAILNANYVAKRLAGHYDVLYAGANGRVAHECILDTRGFKSAGVQVDDIAKRLMDYGFHAPTMSWPVAGTLMVEPTESESKAELDRFCDVMIAIREEIRAIEEGRSDREDNALKHAPHTLASVVATEWNHRYPREQAAFPMPWLRGHKVWPTVGRVDNAYGDRNLVCSCDAWPHAQ